MKSEARMTETTRERRELFSDFVIRHSFDIRHLSFGFLPPPHSTRSLFALPITTTLGFMIRGSRRQVTLLRSPRETVQFACSVECFPLTLTLSLRERERQASNWCLADGRWGSSGTSVIERRWTIPPLPKGEGRGGKPSVAPPTVQSVTIPPMTNEIRSPND